MTERPVVLALAVLLTAPLVAQRQPERGLGVELRTSMLHDTNLDHDETPTPAYGGIVGLALGFRSAADRPVISLRYEVAGHRYTIDNRWNRISQKASALLALRPSRSLVVESKLEVNLKGSSEDRDLGDQYIFAQGVEWRMQRGTSITVAGTARLRRNQISVDRDAVNTYGEIEVSQRLVRGVDIEIGGRVERNDALGDRYDYRRLTATAQLEIAGPFGEVALTSKLKSQRYDSRVVEEIGGEPRRRDQRISLEAEWTAWIWPTTGIIARYEFERRRSNDPDKPYRAHQFGLAFIQTW